MSGTRLVTALLLLLLAVVAMVVLMWAFQRRLIYFPDRRTPPPVTSVLPGAREVGYTTEDDLPLRGWFLPAPGTRQRAAVLVLPGNGGNRADRASLAAVLGRSGLSVLLVDYRGYGGNPGRPSEEGLAADARAARAWLASRPEVDPERMVYFGESLGAAVALRLALEQPPAALVLRSPFTSLADVGRLHYPYLPVRALLAERYASIELVRQLAAPVLVVAGERDRIIPAVHSRRLYDAAPEPRRFVLVPGADHNDLALLAGERLTSEALQFIAEQLPPDSAG
jgi:fermentation-respiration switch protein FrsA (DUF1100 family)